MALRQVSTEFWHDSKVMNMFTPEDKLFYLWCFTNSHLNISGCFKVSIKEIHNEIGYSEPSVELLIDRFQNKHELIQFDREQNELLLLNWHKYNWTKSPKIVSAIMANANKIKNSNFYNYIISKLSENDTQEVKEIEVPKKEEVLFENIKPKTVKRFIPPTLEEVTHYCVNVRKNNVDPKKFYDFFEAGDWIDAKGQKVKNWKQKVITWETFSNSKQDTSKNTEVVYKYAN
jgi:hypothetical protein